MRASALIQGLPIVKGSGKFLLRPEKTVRGHDGFSEYQNYARTIARSSHLVVYCGVRRSCFIDHARSSPASPELARSKVPRP